MATEGLAQSRFLVDFLREEKPAWLNMKCGYDEQWMDLREAWEATLKRGKGIYIRDPICFCLLANPFGQQFGKEACAIQ